MALMQVVSLTVPASPTITNSKTLTGSNATVAVPLFRFTGPALIKKLYGVVTTNLGANHTAGYFRMNDQSAQVAITTSIVGATLSGFVAGGIIMKTGLAAAVAGVKNGNAGGIVEPTTLETLLASEFMLTAKNGANTDLEYVYTTTDTPTSGVIQFAVEYQLIGTATTITAL